MTPPRYSILTALAGVNIGNLFDDTPDAEQFPNARIAAIAIRHARLVDALQVYYSAPSPKATRHGGVGGHTSYTLLQKDEIITTVEGSYTVEAICHLTLVTNKRTLGPYGQPDGQSFSFTAKLPGLGHPPRRMALVSFSGSAGAFIQSLRARFAEMPAEPMLATLVKYEKVQRDIDLDPSLARAELGPVSNFAASLMTPTVTLNVGPGHTKLHANEQVLCRLEFFKAALQGGFKEASEKIIDMPEDPALAVAAMIEFLYTGSYTYAFNAEDGAVLATAPPGTIDEGLFHISVCVTSAKYGCTVLKDGAWDKLQTVLRHTSDIDRLRLWTAAYRNDLQLLQLQDSQGTGMKQGELRTWVGGLFRNHREVVEEILFEDQQLACDLLSLATVSL